MPDHTDGANRVDPPARGEPATESSTDAWGLLLAAFVCLAALAAAIVILLI